MNYRLLIAEDNENNRLLLEDIFRKYQERYQLEFVVLGAEVLPAIQAHPPDLILMDMRLPDYSGWEVAALLKSSPPLFANIPIIAVTAHAMKGDREKAQAAGCDDFVTKPIVKETLLATVEKWLTPKPH